MCCALRCSTSRLLDSPRIVDSVLWTRQIKMKSVVFLMCLVAHSLTAPVPESGSDEIAAQTHTSLQLMELYRMYNHLLQQGIAAPAPPQPQFDGFYQPGAAAPLNSDEAEDAEEAEEAEDAEEAEGAEGAEGAEVAQGAEGAEGTEPAAEEPTLDPTTTDPAAVSIDAPADPEVPLDYLLATNDLNVEFNVADGFDPATITESPLPYLP
ncbi:enamelin isoform X3 [Pangasianodon hypophthalmus]|uniref:enamelin isoform X3 n=1 Tax=Pangasianodon hypophthalmus TaxID=310915 RepID=UPI00230724F9|nr:enamelin isoform X3 [Pangasianodon hypophthalmus]